MVAERNTTRLSDALPARRRDEKSLGRQVRVRLSCETAARLVSNRQECMLSRSSRTCGSSSTVIKYRPFPDTADAISLHTLTPHPVSRSNPSP